MAAELEGRLVKLLAKHGVDEKIHQYLKEKGKLTIGQFAGLADSKADVGDGICVPAGLDKADWPVCQPVKSAWQEADAYVAAELDQIRKGKTTDLDDPIDPEVRKKKTNNFVEYYHMRLSAHLIGSDTLAGRCLREHERKTPTAPDIRKVKSLGHKPSESGEHDEEVATLELHASGVKASTAFVPRGALTHHKFI